MVSVYLQARGRLNKYNVAARFLETGEGKKLIAS